jgi:hypothetical protein
MSASTRSSIAHSGDRSMVFAIDGFQGVASGVYR